MHEGGRSICWSTDMDPLREISDGHDARREEQTIHRRDVLRIGAWSLASVAGALFPHYSMADNSQPTKTMTPKGMDKKEMQDPKFNRTKYFVAETLSLPLKDIFLRSTCVFIGTVKEDTNRVKKIGEKETKCRKTSMKLEQVWKGKGLGGGQAVELDRDLDFATALEEGEQVLWFLSEEEGPFRFSYPVGIHSGDFRITRDPKDPTIQYVTNLQRNDRLWSKRGPLWEEGSGFTESGFRAELEKMGLSKERIAQMMKIAGEPCENKPIPLEIILAAYRSFMPKAKSKQEKNHQK